MSVSANIIASGPAIASFNWPKGLSRGTGTGFGGSNESLLLAGPSSSSSSEMTLLAGVITASSTARPGRFVSDAVSTSCLGIVMAVAMVSGGSGSRGAIKITPDTAPAAIMQERRKANPMVDLRFTRDPEKTSCPLTKQPTNAEQIPKIETTLRQARQAAHANASNCRQFLPERLIHAPLARASYHHSRARCL